ncbi:MFS transporter [Plantibacter sp. VKM Ac-2880]|uniref:MFS transporter n=1 Tax=Plantibacter sp. VKM Ac-2880 TaxID=2783827 RepID=UPI00188FBD7D|nr:MFS transporter [Plantibacter sp. VKM Ac-2880]MBF4569965.1 MFS transporter [Plantibacter sp. VKM Ac-2880]
MTTDAAPTAPPTTLSPARGRSPLPTALLLAAVGFVTLLTEVLPAGVLPAMAADLGTTEAIAGQSVAVFALGCIVAAIPISRLLARLDRRTVALLAIAVSALANAGTAAAPDLLTHLATRFAAGLVAGVVWAMLPGYTRGFTSPERFGSTLGIVLSGATLGFALGVPAGAVLSAELGWRAVFGIVAAATALLGVVAVVVAPRVAGTVSGRSGRMGAALRLPAVVTILVALAVCIIGQNIAYTYLAPVLADRGTPVPLGLLLAVFGVASVVGTLGAGRLANVRLGATILGAAVLGTVGLSVVAVDPPVALLLVAAGGWGLAFGAYSVLFQVAIARVAGDAADAAQSALVTMWNVSIAVGGAVGGIILGTWGAALLLPAAAALTVIAVPLGVAIARSVRPR